MFGLIVGSIGNTILIFILSIIFTITINYIFNKDFKYLIKQIKRVILNHRKVNKITQIKNIIYNYFF